MRNFNPIFNYLNLTKSSSPFALAGSTAANRAASSAFISKGLTNKITLSGILNGAQKTIGTVNQIVPLYNQIKPMFNNSKILLSVAKNLRGSPRSSRAKFNTNTINVESVTTKQEKKKENTNKSAITEGEPSKPFFI